MRSDTVFVIRRGDNSKTNSPPNNSETQTILGSQEINVAHGSSHITFPPDKRYSGVLVLAAYLINLDLESSYQVSGIASASVVFPHAASLQLDVKPLKATYRPGESATVNLRVRGAQGEAAEGALGLLVYDQALEELSRTEASFATSWEDRIDPRLGFVSFPDSGDSLAGVSVKDLLNRAPDAAVPSDLELLAQAIFAGHSFAPLRVESSDYARYFSQIFNKQIRATLDPLSKILQDHFAVYGHFPANDGEFAKILSQHNLNPASITDPWGRPYHITRSTRWTSEVLEFHSEGPDKTPNTADDFLAMALDRPFLEHGAEWLRKILDAYRSRTGSYIRDLAALQAERWSRCDAQHSG